MPPTDVKVGFDGDTKTVRVETGPNDPAPWGLDDLKKMKVVGTATPRQEAAEKVTGRAKYSSDMTFPGMLVAKLLRSPHAAAGVVSVDVSEARTMPGVKDARAVDVPGGSVLYAGQAVACVTAETPEQALAALSKIKVSYSPKKFVVKLEDALEEGSPRVRANRANAAEPQTSGSSREEAIKGADYQVEATYTTEVQTHSAHEPHGLVAVWEGTDKLTVYASTQGTFGVRGQFAQRFRLRPENVRCITHHMGGGFGAKLRPGFEGFVAADVARDLKRPVKIFLDRHSEHVDGGNRPNSHQQMRAGINKDGRITGLEVVIAGSGGFGGGSGCANPAIYRFGQNVVYKSERGVAMNTGAAAAFRAPGRPQGSFALESFMDELAWRVKADPIAFRLSYLNDRQDKLYAHELKVGAETFDWSKAYNKQPGSGKGPFKRGAGMALTSWGQIGGPGASATCIVRSDGSVEIRNGSQDIGTGTRTLMSVVVAEQLGLPVAAVKGSIGDTEWPLGPASGGSNTSPTVMPAVRAAAFAAQKKLAALVAAEWGIGVEYVQWDGSTAVAALKRMAWKDVCALIPGETLTETASRDANFDTYRGGVCGAQFAEVEVDVETGVVRVLRVLAVQDCGTVVNRLTAESQIMGGVLQGVSYALFENRVMCRNTGRQVNPNEDGYKILGAVDAPRIDVMTVQLSNGGNSVGLAGLGEAPNIPTAGAIGNAIFNASGARVRSLPMTPDLVLAAVEEWEKSKK